MTAIRHHLAGGDTATIRVPRLRARPWIAVVGAMAWGATLLRFTLMAFGS